jgi:hypothetical protein
MFSVVSDSIIKTLCVYDWLRSLAAHNKFYFTSHYNSQSDQFNFRTFWFLYHCITLWRVTLWLVFIFQRWIRCGASCSVRVSNEMARRDVRQETLSARRGHHDEEKLVDVFISWIVHCWKVSLLCYPYARFHSMLKQHLKSHKWTWTQWAAIVMVSSWPMSALLCLWFDFLFYFLNFSQPDVACISIAGWKYWCTSTHNLVIMLGLVLLHSLDGNTTPIVLWQLFFVWGREGHL